MNLYPLRSFYRGTSLPTCFCFLHSPNPQILTEEPSAKDCALVLSRSKALLVALQSFLPPGSCRHRALPPKPLASDSCLCWKLQADSSPPELTLCGISPLLSALYHSSQSRVLSSPHLTRLIECTPVDFLKPQREVFFFKNCFCLVLLIFICRGHAWTHCGQVHSSGENLPPPFSEGLEGTEEAGLTAPAFPKCGEDCAHVQTLCSLLRICFCV